MPDTDLSHIEETLAHQDRQISDLSDIVTKQWDEIEILKKRIGRMQDKIVELEENNAEDSKGLSASEQAARDKPPHY